MVKKHPHGGSQRSITAIPLDLMPSSGGQCTHRQNIHLHKVRNKSLKKDRKKSCGISECDRFLSCLTVASSYLYYWSLVAL